MKVGSLVLCVDDAGFREKGTWEIGVNFPVKDQIYTVRTINSGGVLLEEIVNPRYEYKEGFMEIRFHPKRFREIQPPMDLTELLEETVKHTLVISQPVEI